MEQEKEILHMRNLIKLGINESDCKLKEDLMKMISYVDIIKQADLTGLEPEEKQEEYFQNIFREDEPPLEAEHFHRDKLLQNAPKTAEGYLVVPKTVGE